MVFGLLLVAAISWADEVTIPFAIHVEDFKKEVKENGFDLYDGDGFVENKGGEFKVFTYKPVKFEHLDLFRKIAIKHLRK